MGPSGSGKSTLLNLVAGLDRPRAARVRVAGSRFEPWRRRSWRAGGRSHIGHFQLYNLIPVLTAFENVELPLCSRPSRGTSGGSTSRRRSARRARRPHGPLPAAALGRTGTARRDRPRDRDRSPLLLADEPTGDLDAKSAEEVLTLLKRLNGEFGKTIVMVTHDAAAAERATVCSTSEGRRVERRP